MLRLVMALVLAICTSTACGAQIFDKNSEYSAASWLKRCKSERYSFGFNACIFYLQGLVDGQATFGNNLFCPPKEATLGEEMAVVIAFLDRTDSDSVLAAPFAWAAAGALKHRYPCPAAP